MYRCLKILFQICMWHGGKQNRHNCNDSNIKILMYSVERTVSWQEQTDLSEKYSSCCRIQCISLPLKSFTIRIFVQFPITSLMFRLNTNVQNITETVKCPREPTKSATRFVYTIPQHDQFYHHNYRGLPSPTQPVLPTLFLLSVRKLIITKNLGHRTELLVITVTNRCTLKDL
jgi:hypothetical protein